jgi:hypothetical protein
MKRLRSLVRRQLDAIATSVNVARFGRPAGLIRTADYLARGAGQWHPAIPAEARERRPPRQFGALAADLTSALEPFSDLGVTTVPGGTILAPHGWVFTADGHFLGENSWYGRHAGDAALPRSFPPVKRLRGTCLSIASDFAAANYGHFVLDCLGRYAVFLKSGLSIDQVDHIYCPKPVSPSARRIMQAVGVPEAKCVWSDEAPFVQADTVLATSFPGSRRNYPAWLNTFLRSAIAVPAAASARVYVPRDGVRRISNDTEVRAVLQDFGFVTFDFRTVADEAGYFGAAAMVVGPHGAGLTNLAFCQPGTKVLELIPSDHVHPYYYTLSESGGLDYSYMVGRSLGSRPAGTFGPSPYDFVVDIDELRGALTTLTA